MKNILILLSFITASHSTFSLQICKTDAEIPKTAPDSRFVINANGTIFDTHSELTWTRCVIGKSGASCENGAAELHDYYEALDIAAVSEFAGFINWRIPNVKELASITEKQCHDPAMNLNVFPGPFVSTTKFASSSPFLRVGTYHGEINKYPSLADRILTVYLVRDKY